MTANKYKISFTTGALFYREAVMTAELYFRLKDWQLVSAEILSENLLKSRTRSSLLRTTRELIQRLQVLTEDQLLILVDGTRQEQNQILWLAVCKQYRFVHEFSIEVIREKLHHLDYQISHLDFDIFFNTKAEWNEELENLKVSTRQKLRQVLFRMLVEADIISPGFMILSTMLSARVISAVKNDDADYFTIFPITEGDIRDYKNHDR